MDTIKNIFSDALDVFCTIIIWVLKIVVTILCPPVGLAWIFENGAGFLLGMFISVFVNIAVFVHFDNTVYDNPKITTSLDTQNVLTGLPKVFACPLSVYFSFEKATYLKINRNKSYIVWGDRVVVFDKEKNEYVLNFNEESKFGQPMDSLGIVSVKGAEDLLKKCSDEKNLVNIREARSALEETKTEYETIRAAFQSAVDKMNREYKEMQMLETRDSNSQKN